MCVVVPKRKIYLYEDKQSLKLIQIEFSLHKCIQPIISGQNFGGNA